jgi:hypothetical protein
MIMGFIGIYIGYIFQEVKGRPIYIIQNIQAMQKDPSDTTNRSGLSDETH